MSTTTHVRPLIFEEKLNEVSLLYLTSFRVRLDHFRKKARKKILHGCFDTLIKI